MNENELRELLESMPCPFCTDGIGDDVLAMINYDLNLEMQDCADFVKEGTMTKDKYNSHWWAMLEHLANYYNIPYYEDLPN